MVQDPWGLMEGFSRKVLKAGVMGFYGRWGLPVRESRSVVRQRAAPICVVTPQIIHACITGAARRGAKTKRTFSLFF